MDFLLNAWTISAPIIFIVVLLISIYFLARFTQRQSNRLFLKMASEIRALFVEQVSANKSTVKNNPHKLLSYTSLALSSLISLFIVGFILGFIMLYAVSQILSFFELSILPSFFKMIFEWFLLVTSSVLLIFAGIYASKLLSYYIYKIQIPHAHLIVQITSSILLFLSVFISFRNMDSASSIVNFSLLIVTASLLIALISPIMKWHHVKSNHKSKAA
ncbi:MAG TPA: hypothetical protein ENO27_03815 [Caldithrix sp.]|nr:hypothetical protein [Calditrichaceae bacterium]HEM49319.1 hypothetical protein [Caldithrix sp.]